MEVRNEFDEVTGTHIAGNLVVSGGAGNDEITIGGDPGDDRGLDVFLNMTIDAGAGNDLVDIQGTTTGLITTILMGAGNDELDIFTSGGGTPQATLIADGGAGKDSFFNDLGITSNGNQDFDGNGVPHEIIRNFEFFEAEAVMTALAKSKKGGW